ncbi:MAG: hypothetical protein LC631_05940, partial [Desulfovibrionales bacterium]|nr:hypothetical protein [Desulfovibrionales bacterium]
MIFQKVKGERGKFNRPGSTINIPVYLDKKSFDFVQKIASEKRITSSSVVNQLLRNNMRYFSSDGSLRQTFQ